MFSAWCFWHRLDSPAGRWWRVWSSFGLSRRVRCVNTFTTAFWASIICFCCSSSWCIIIPWGMRRRRRACMTFIYTTFRLFSHIIKYQDNLTNSPPACDLMEQLNTTHAEIFMKKHCKEKPTFSAGRSNVRSHVGIFFTSNNEAKLVIRVICCVI